jgi:hypothetical protein
MKKSQLRNIIRESIKQLLTEAQCRCNYTRSDGSIGTTTVTGCGACTDECCKEIGYKGLADEQPKVKSPGENNRKNSQLRDTIRESIKKLITEAQGTTVSLTMVGYPVLIPGWSGVLGQNSCGGFGTARWHSLCCMNQPSGFLQATSGPQPISNGGTGGQWYSGAQHVWNNINLNQPPDQTPCVPGCIQAASMVAPITQQQVLDFIQQHTTGNIIYDPTSPFPSSGTIQPMTYFNGTPMECRDWVQAAEAPTWKCAEGKHAGEFECIEVDIQGGYNPGPYSSLAACQADNINIPNGCGGGVQAKKTDPTPAKPIIQKPDPTPANPEIDRMQDLANIKK